MRLVLASWFLPPGCCPPALPSTREGARAGIVLNALDEYGHSRARDLGREVRTLEALGYSCAELDLREHFSARTELPHRLAGLDLVWALGGNAFVLARAMAGAGFRDAVRAQLHRPEFVYGGYSAGACVAGPDLRGIDLIDDPTVRPEGCPAHVEPACLGLLPYRIVPHWRSDHRDAKGADRAAAHLAAQGLAHRCLRDGDVLNIHDAAALIPRP